MGRLVEDEEVLTLRQLLAMREARLADAMAEIERLKMHLAANSREHTVPAEQNPG